MGKEIEEIVFSIAGVFFLAALVLIFFVGEIAHQFRTLNRRLAAKPEEKESGWPRGGDDGL